MNSALLNILAETPVISAVRDKFFGDALSSPSRVIFLLGGSILNLSERVRATHEKGKIIFVHIDLAEGIGKDRAGIQYLKSIGVDGVITTKAALIKTSKEQGLLTVQRFFAYDSQGIEGVLDMLEKTAPDFAEIMPGVIGKIIKRFANSGIPLIAGGLIDEKGEVTSALSFGAVAVSTGKKELWYI